ncbi:unnamed protein product [Amoebophrya sp. A120]|nr:unnamed protein product [Amoebophrya sp. A120]|eukprot:GSA120T00002179001.1
MIPMTLRVNLEVAKVFHSWQIQLDKQINGTVVRNSQRPEELGVIDYVLSDKTGTLTRNEMIFQKLRTSVGEFTTRQRPEDLARIREAVRNCVLLEQQQENNSKENVGYQEATGTISRGFFEGDEDKDPISRVGGPAKNVMLEESHVNHNCERNYPQIEAPLLGERDDGQNTARRRTARHDPASAGDHDQHENFHQLWTTGKEIVQQAQQLPRGSGALEELVSLQELHQDAQEAGGRGLFDSSSTIAPVAPPPHQNVDARTDESIFDAIRCLALCHNVTPHGSGSSWDLQGASPDEIALVKFANSSGLKLTQRTDYQIEVTLTGSGDVLRYKILECFPFTSETKRMGILVQRESCSVGNNSFAGPSQNKPEQEHGSQTNDNKRNSSCSMEPGSSADVKMATAADSPSSTEQGPVMFYLKGADNVMSDFLKRKHQSSWLQEEVENYARTGLRTLVLAKKLLSFNEYSEWKKKYDTAKNAMRSREEKIRRAVDVLEQNLDLVALTGVEDMLTEDVQETLEAVRHAGIKIWMLTGDKVETAICIAISTSLKARHQNLFVLENKFVETKEVMMKLAEYAELKVSNTVLVIDGKVLTVLLKPENVKTFITTAKQAPAIVCCRCSPTQKADIVLALEKYGSGGGGGSGATGGGGAGGGRSSRNKSSGRGSGSGSRGGGVHHGSSSSSSGPRGPPEGTRGNHASRTYGGGGRASSISSCCQCRNSKNRATSSSSSGIPCRTLAIGDGGNDVSMIQAAHVGVGIRGKEGQQASLAADYSVENFKVLRRLLLVHGRLNFQRSVRLSILIIHRGLVFSFLQALFSALFYFVSVPLFQGVLYVGYASVYTMFLLFSVVFDTELPETTVLLYPELYSGLREEQRMSVKIFLLWVAAAVFNAAVIILLALRFFEEEMINIVSIVFTACFLLECLFVICEVSVWHPLILIGELVSLLLVLYTMISTPQFFRLDFILRPEFFLLVAGIIFVAWFPIYLIRRLVRYWQPSQHRKLVSAYNGYEDHHV